DIDYAWVNAFTTYGEIGVQVWINRGEILPTRKNKPASKPAKGGNR
ncbi:MAG: 30S ribosomal protein S3, partial [Lactobacillus crispatus]|nr:30S ribosomal protein S3 [Lactobacillus crispatus]